jgi:hypothetical protein
MSNGDGAFAPQEAPFARIFDIQVLISKLARMLSARTPGVTGPLRQPIGTRRCPTFAPSAHVLA